MVLKETGLRRGLSEENTYPLTVPAFFGKTDQRGTHSKVFGNALYDHLGACE